MATRFLFLALVDVFVFQLACATANDDTNARDEHPHAEAMADLGEVAAIVDGRAILLDDVRFLAEHVDGGLPIDEALDLLIENALLVEEARRRGYDRAAEIEDSRRNALAREALKKRIGGEINENTIDHNLKHFYKTKKGLFVHGPMREVVHIVALIGKDKLADDTAKELITALHQRAEGVESVEDFEVLGQELEEQHPGLIKVERLPAFEADNKKYAKEFTEATSELEHEGDVSPPVETKFGWHLIYLDRVLPAKNESFEQARELIAPSLLPKIRRWHALEFIKGLREKGEVFVHEDRVRNELVDQP